MNDSSSYPKVFSLIEFHSVLPESAIDSALKQIAEETPFSLNRLSVRGSGCWLAEFAPREMEMDVRFAKAAELQIQVARKFDVRSATFTSETREPKGAPWPATQ